MHRKKLIVVAVIMAIAVPLSIVAVLAAASPPPVIESLEADPERVFPSGSTQIVCTVSGPDGASLSYEWWASEGEIDGDGAMVTWTAPGVEKICHISVTVSDGRGRQDTDTLVIVAKHNQPPVVHSLTAEPNWTTPSGSLRLICDAEDPDGHTLSYQWSAEAGHFEGTGAEVTWLAPEQTGIYEITVVVSDDYGGSAADALYVSVMRGQPPVVEALLVTATHKYLRPSASSERYEVGEGKTFAIECIASHPDGVQLAYEWEYDAGEITGASEDESSITWTAPSRGVTATVTVTTSDPSGNMARRSVSLEVVSCSRFG
ncbi:MAG: hypothetical protein IBX67_00640 [Dehalococcoidia bacterium]|nr:hypothetical protein [Dehalococcoidia bacterium]